MSISMYKLFKSIKSLFVNKKYVALHVTPIWKSKLSTRQRIRKIIIRVIEDISNLEIFIR